MCAVPEIVRIILLPHRHVACMSKQSNEQACTRRTSELIHSTSYRVFQGVIIAVGPFFYSFARDMNLK